MKLLRFKFTIPILAGIYFLIAIFANMSINNSDGAIQAELGGIFSVIPLINAFILIFLYFLSYHILNSVKVQIISTILSLVIFVPILIYMFFLFMF